MKYRLQSKPCDNQSESIHEKVKIKRKNAATIMFTSQIDVFTSSEMLFSSQKLFIHMKMGRSSSVLDSLCILKPFHESMLWLWHRKPFPILYRNFRRSLRIASDFSENKWSAPDIPIIDSLSIFELTSFKCYLNI